MAAGPKRDGGVRADIVDAGRAARFVLRSARHSAVPGVAGPQTASKLAFCAAVAAATEGGVSKDAAARATKARDTATRRVTPERMTNAGPPRLPDNPRSPNYVPA